MTRGPRLLLKVAAAVLALGLVLLAGHRPALGWWYARRAATETDTATIRGVLRWSSDAAVERLAAALLADTKGRHQFLLATKSPRQHALEEVLASLKESPVPAERLLAPLVRGAVAAPTTDELEVGFDLAVAIARARLEPEVTLHVRGDVVYHARANSVERTSGTERLAVFLLADWLAARGVVEKTFVAELGPRPPGGPTRQGLGVRLERSLFLATVEPSGLAAKAGLRPGDALVRIDYPNGWSRLFYTPDAVREELARKTPLGAGPRWLTYERESVQSKAAIPLDAWDGFGATVVAGLRLGRPYAGLAAARAGARANDILRSVDGQAVTKPTDATGILEGKQRVRLGVTRGGESLTLDVELDP